jgi:4-hydroxybutyrate CoA-transferase
LHQTTAADAIDRIPAGSHVVASPFCGLPRTLVNTLAARAEGQGLTLMTGLIFDYEAIADAVRSGDLAYRTWHLNAALEPLLAEGLISYLPMRASRVPAQLTSWKPEVALVRVTPPDRNGWCSLGPSVCYVRAALESATLRIAEVDPALPRTWGQSMVHVSDLDLLVESSEPMSVYTAATPNPVSTAIARHVMELLPERPLLQLGIGAVPEALVTALGEHGMSELRFTGMASDGMVDLAERGLLDLRYDRGFPPISTPDLLGTSRLMQWADDNPSVGLYPSTTAQNPLELARLERLVSINSAVEVDLAGQVNSERVRGRQISGIGGSIDFTEAATQSPGGMRIIALPSTTSDGKVSRIVPRLGESSAVTIPGALVELVVTEHGVARLEGRSTRERAEALAAIAAPQHREQLLSAMQ